MQITPVNNTSFKSYICTNFNYNKKMTKTNAWPTLVKIARQSPESLPGFDMILRRLNFNGDNNILAFEEDIINHSYHFALYENEDLVEKDRILKNNKINSLNQNAIFIKEKKHENPNSKSEEKYYTLENIEGDELMSQRYDSMFDAAKDVLAILSYRTSELREKLTSNLYAETKIYLKQYAKNS